MYRRLEIVSRRLDWVGVTHRSSYPLMLERLVGMDSAKSLKTLADLLEPVKFYERGQSRDYTSQTHLNRLVDATRPESHVARKFAKLVENSAASKGEVRKRLTLWRDNSAALVPVMKRASLLEEAVPLAEDVSALAAAGLEALDYLGQGRAAPKSWVDAKTQLLKRAEKPRAELLIMIVPSIRKLVEMAAQGNR